MTPTKRQARRIWAAAIRKAITRGDVYFVEFRHDAECAIYTPEKRCDCDPHRVLKNDAGHVLVRIEGAGSYDPLELVEGAQ